MLRQASLDEEVRRSHPSWCDRVHRRLLAALELEKTLQWALNLKTRSAVIYGKICPGGKPLPMKKKLHIAHTAIINRGIDKLECFNEALEMECMMFGIDKDQLMNS